MWALDENCLKSNKVFVMVICCHPTFLLLYLKLSISLYIVRECKEIEGIKVGNHEMKLSVFPDDLRPPFSNICVHLLG